MHAPRTLKIIIDLKEFFLAVCAFSLLAAKNVTTYVHVVPAAASLNVSIRIASGMQLGKRKKGEERDCKPPGEPNVDTRRT